ncbi:hypothetical protein WICPIJ_008152 [Wickerhamomyces pijperi]|uniref:V-type proton ATPase subunit G n=1 Tax=Wickerhamomyces pijperi TaxID=599730 RepID=A0A9P8TIE0_WICPI|nr:hypothetical protein WICPIJ_008152 [Wickerhamomyces pijperi]
MQSIYKSNPPSTSTEILTIHQQSQNINTLLKVEKEAHAIVNESRNYRTQKLKSAKVDAQEEIQAYKAAKETELEKFKQDHSGLTATLEAEAASKVETELQQIKDVAASKKDHVVGLLLKAVVEPTPELHINAQ